MSTRVLVAVFGHPEDLRGAVRTARAQDLSILEVYSPYAIHGLDEDLGWAPSRLPWVGAIAGAIGLAGILWLQFWTSTVNWPINVGGRPWNSLPAYVPVAFEVIVLAGALTTVGALLLVSRLWPGQPRQAPVRGVTDHRFALVLQPHNAACDARELERDLAACRPLRVEERLASSLRPLVLEPVGEELQ